jgi:hypothetical protein
VEFSPKIDILGHKASLNKSKKIEIIFFILSDNNGIQLEINNKGNYREYSNTCRPKKYIDKQPVGHQRNKERNHNILLTRTSGIQQSQC